MDVMIDGLAAQTVVVFAIIGMSVWIVSIIWQIPWWKSQRRERQETKAAHTTYITMIKHQRDFWIMDADLDRLFAAREATIADIHKAKEIKLGKWAIALYEETLAIIEETIKEKNLT